MWGGLHRCSQSALTKPPRWLRTKLYPNQLDRPNGGTETRGCEGCRFNYETFLPWGLEPSAVQTPTGTQPAASLRGRWGNTASLPSCLIHSGALRSLRSPRCRGPHPHPPGGSCGSSQQSIHQADGKSAETGTARSPCMPPRGSPLHLPQLLSPILVLCPCLSTGQQAPDPSLRVS